MPTTLGSYLRQQRLARGWRLTDVADRLERRLSIAYLSDIEHDRRSAPPDTLQDIANALSLDYDILCWHARIYPPDIETNRNLFTEESIRLFFARIRAAIKEDTKC